MKKNRILITISAILFAFNSCFGGINNKTDNENDFEIKGFHLDLRIQVMKLDALKDFADELASFGINTLIMEWEATFPFESHPLIPNRYAYTKKEIQEFIAYCTQLNIDVIPMQQSLGHVEYILRHARYAQQRENQKDVSQICPMEPDLNRALFTDLITEMAKTHPSKYFHIGGDEAYLFGECDKCSHQVKEHGKAKLLADHLKMVCEVVVSQGKTPVLWADVANKYPEELSKLPKETIFLVWNYGWSLDRFGDPKKLTDKGFEVWGAPSLRSNPDNFYLTRWEYHFNNNRDFIPQCRNSGYNGMIMTSWSTSGVYSTIFEDKQTITDLLAVRNVYPITGFRILLAAYAQAIHQKEALDIEEFIIAYCNKRFGLNKEQALEFWEAIKGNPYEVIDGNAQAKEKITVETMLSSARQDQKVLNGLTPSENKTEFEHFRLMKDIRENYLMFKAVEVKTNKPDFSNKDIPETLTQLNEILEKDKSIKIRFKELNKDLLYASEIEKENQIRIKRVQLLYNRLSKKR